MNEREGRFFLKALTAARGAQRSEGCANHGRDDVECRSALFHMIGWPTTFEQQQRPFPQGEELRKTWDKCWSSQPEIARWLKAARAAIAEYRGAVEALGDLAREDPA